MAILDIYQNVRVTFKRNNLVITAILDNFSRYLLLYMLQETCLVNLFLKHIAEKAKDGQLRMNHANEG